MATSKSISWQVSDIIQWYRAKELVVNERFQRHSVWTPQAKTFLIDTLLLELPIPKIYIRTILDPKRQTSLREIIDGQQRVRAICEFANNEFALTSRSSRFRGKTYSDLADEEQQKLLGYVITAEQLLNATDDDVIDIFARLNSYTVVLNAAEKRHSKYQTEFKFAVRRATQWFRPFVEKYELFTTRQRFRMADDEFFAQIYQLLSQGVVDGGQASIDGLYKMNTDAVFNEDTEKEAVRKVQEALSYLDVYLSEILRGSLARHYQVLMMLAAYFHAKYGLPDGQVDNPPVRGTLDVPEKIKQKLANLEAALDTDSASERDFVQASSSSTQRIASRSVRYKRFYAAFTQ